MRNIKKIMLFGLLLHGSLFFEHSLEARWFRSKKKTGAKNSTVSATQAAGAFNVSSKRRGAKKYSTLKNVLLYNDSSDMKGDAFLFNFAKIVSNDLDFTGQFDVDLRKSKKRSSASCKDLFKKGVSLATFFERVKNGVRVIVKDTSSDMILFDRTVKGLSQKRNIVLKGHQVSSDILKTLTGDGGVCLSSLAYCKQISPRKKVICVSDYMCHQNKVVVKNSTINLAPRWFKGKLLYSQLTKKNNRLMSYDTEKKKHSVVLSFPGLNMQPTFSPDGKKVVVCLSGGRGNSELYMHDQKICQKLKKRVFRQLTRNGAHNVSPTLLPDGNIVFCSDFQTRLPQLYHMNLSTNKITRLTSGKGYAAAPSYNSANNLIVYTRPVKGVFQLFVLDLNLKNPSAGIERQITFGMGNKHEPCWSFDGRYVAFSTDISDSKGRRIPQIAVMNYSNGKYLIVTRDSAPKSFPRWTGGTVWS